MVLEVMNLRRLEEAVFQMSQSKTKKYKATIVVEVPDDYCADTVAQLLYAVVSVGRIELTEVVDLQEVKL